MEKTYYQILGVRKNATLKSIKAAYKKMSSKLHPDKNKEDTTEQFQELKHAYEVLKDPDRRAHYNQTGNDDFVNASKITEQANNVLLNTYMAIVERSNFEPKNYFFDMQNEMKGGLAKMAQDIVIIEDKVRKLEYLINHTEGDEFLGLAMGSKVAHMKHQVVLIKEKLDVVKRALELLKVYKYTGEHRATPNSGFVNFINV